MLKILYAYKSLTKHQTYRISCLRILTNLPYIGKVTAENLCGKLTLPYEIIVIMGTLQST